jgi:murein DD-endopeptidase MepM/ murein hydrolase activator NlpD
MHPIDHEEKRHEGIDFAGSTGDPVKCTANGRVIFAGVQRGYGNIIIVQHSETLSSAYGHLSAIDVEVGEAVAQGQKIGKVGSTGNSTGPHLHFEIRENGEQVNPTKYL